MRKSNKVLSERTSHTKRNWTKQRQRMKGDVSKQKKVMCPPDYNSLLSCMHLQNPHVEPVLTLWKRARALMRIYKRKERTMLMAQRNKMRRRYFIRWWKCNVTRLIWANALLCSKEEFPCFISSPYVVVFKEFLAFEHRMDFL